MLRSDVGNNAEPGLNRASTRSGSRLAAYATFALLALAMLGPYMTVGADSILVGNLSEGAGNSARQFSYLTIFLAAIIGARAYQKPSRLLVLPLSLTLALGWCWLSVLWAIDPSIAFRRVILTTLVIWTIFILVREVKFEETVGIMRIVLLGTLVVNYCAVLFRPDLGVHQLAQVGDPNLVGNWRGVLMQKNFAGAVCAFTIIIYLLDAGKINAILRWAVVLAAAFFLFQTSSKTSMRLLLPALVIGIASMKYNARYRTWLITGFITICLFGSLIFIIYGEDVLSAFMGGSSTLTGRTEIWQVMFNYLQDHWLLGAGYGSFWNIGPASPIYQYSRGWLVMLGNGHNGYLDLALQVGVPGMVLVTFAAIVWPLLRLFSSRIASPARRALIVAVVIFCAGHNITETSLFDRDMIVHVFLMFAIALICIETTNRTVWVEGTRE